MEKVLASGDVGSVKLVQAGGELQFVAALEEVALLEMAIAAFEKKYPASAVVLEPAKAFIEPLLKRS